MEIIEKKELLELLPHRPPFLFVDRVTALTPGEEAAGTRLVHADEPFFAGHFPGNPVMPGVIVVEALAQLACVLAFKSLGGYEGQSVYLMGVDDARFRRVVKPGDLLTLHAKVDKQRRNIWFFETKAHVGDELAVAAKICAGVGL